MENYYSLNSEFTRKLGLQPGLDQTLYYEELENAKIAAFWSIDLDFHDAVVVTDVETGEVVAKIGEISFVA